MTTSASRDPRASVGHRRVNQLIVLAGGIALLVDAALALSSSQAAENLATLVVPFGFLSVGWLIVRRYPAQVEGRLLLVVGASFAVILGLPFDGGWVIPVGVMGTHLLLRFPDGQLPSRRWWWFSRWCTLMIVVLTVVVTTGSQVTTQGVSNPYYVPWTTALSFFIAAFPLSLLASVASVILRYRRSGTLKRAQIRWLAAAASVMIGLYVTTLVVSFAYDGLHDINSANSSWFAPRYPVWLLTLQFTALMSFLLIPAAFGIAILRYRLYDIDRLISRASAYLLVTGLLLATFAAIVVGGSQLLGNESSVVVAAATLAAAAVARPLLRRVQAAVDHRFNRAGFDALSTVEEFGVQLRAELDVDQVEALLLGAVGRTLQPSAAGLHLLSPP
jgi:hypothetical protein